MRAMCGNKYNIYLQIYKPLSLQMCTHSRPHMPVCKFQCVLLLHCRLTCIYRTPLSAAHSYITLAAFPKRLMPFSSCQYMWISTMCSHVYYIYICTNGHAVHLWRTLWIYPFTAHIFQNHFFCNLNPLSSYFRYIHAFTHMYIYI